MISGCFVNVVDTFQPLYQKANAKYSLSDRVQLTKWLPSNGFSHSNASMLWSTIVNFRVKWAELDKHLCGLNPTFDAASQRKFNQQAVESVFDEGEWILQKTIDFVGIQERWHDSLQLLACIFQIPFHLLNTSKKVVHLI